MSEETNIHGVPAYRPQRMEQFMVKLKGEQRSFHCPGDGENGCGCNVFHKEPGEPYVYICNSCGIRWRGEL
jgi:hypothetical protein